MKVALLIGVSDYGSRDNSLPGCKNDLSLMQRLLEATGEFRHVHSLLCDGMSTSQVRQNVSAWIDERKNDDVEEFLLYYTGHGKFTGEQLFFPMSDFRGNRINQYSLTNTEFDNWIRALEPEFAVKVLDACNSGVPYIKGERDGLASFLKASASEVVKRYLFMSSSTASQSSYQGPDHSDFTRAFADAIVNHPEKTILYRDIVAYISDEFKENADIQQPLFVEQVFGTEIFSSNRPADRAKVFGDPEPQESSEMLPDPLPRLKKLAEQADQRYPTPEEATQTLEKMKVVIESHEYSSQLKALFEAKAEFVRAANLPLGSEAGKLAKELRNDFFVRDTYTTVMLTRRAPGYNALYASTVLGSPYESYEQDELSGFKPTIAVPFEAVTIKATSSYRSLVPYFCAITYFVSPSQIKLLHYYTHYRYLNWVDVELVPAAHWNTADYELADRDVVVRAVTAILHGFEQHIMESARRRIGDM